MKNTIVTKNSGVAQTKWALGVLILLAGLLSGCLADNDSKEEELPASLGDVAVFTSDYTSGELRWFSQGDTSYARDSIRLHQDSKIINGGFGYIFALERFGADNIVRLDPTSSENSVVYQISLEENANPQDIEVAANGQAFVSLENTGYLLRIDAGTGAESARLDLSSLAYGENTTPNAGAMILAADRLFVLLQRRDGWMAAVPGLLAVVDATNFTLLDTVGLHFYNPHSLVLHQGKLLISGAGSLPWEGSVVSDSSRGIVEVDVQTLQTRVITTDVQLGGAPQDIALDPDGVLWVSIYRSFGDQVVRAINLGTAAVGNALEGVKDASGGLVWDNTRNLLYIGDRELENSAVRIWDGQTLRSLSRSGALPPYSIALF